MNQQECVQYLRAVATLMEGIKDHDLGSIRVEISLHGSSAPAWITARLSGMSPKHVCSRDGGFKTAWYQSGDTFSDKRITAYCERVTPANTPPIHIENEDVS